MNKKKLIGIIILCFFIVLRFTFLDQDTHSRMIEGINQNDEVFYTHKGFIKYLASEERLGKESKVAPFSNNFSTYNAHISYLSFKIFGNNYYGLRIPAVLMSLIALLLLYKTGLSLYNSNLYILYGAMLLLFSDFYFFIFSRFQTPQIYSIFIISLILYIFHNKNLKFNTKSFLLGLIGTIAVLNFYLFNLFLLASIGLYLLTISIRKKNISTLVYSLFGVLLGGFIFFISIEGSIQDYFKLLQEHNDQFKLITNEVSFTEKIINTAKKVIAIFTTNLFRFNPIFLWAFISIPIISFVNIIKKKSNKTELFLFYIIIFIIAQNSFASSYPYKKLIVLAPISFIALIYIFKQISERKISPPLILFSSITSLIIYLYSIKVNYSPEYWATEKFGYNYIPLKSTYIYLLLLGFIFFLIFISLYTYKNIRLKLTYPIVAFSLLLIIIELDYFIINPEFTYKNTLLKYAKTIKENRITGGYAKAYSLYSEATPDFTPIRFKDSYKAEVEKEIYAITKKHKTFRIEHYRKANDVNKNTGEQITFGKTKYLIIDKSYQKDSLYCLYLMKDLEEEK